MTDLPRYWKDSNWPRPRSPRYPDELRTDMYQVLEGLAYKTRENPAELSTVLAAAARMGYSPYALDMGVENGGMFWALGNVPWPLEKAREAITDALRGRTRRVLTARADGLLLAVEHTARQVVAHRLHALQVDGQRIDPTDLKPLNPPTEAEWNEIIATAKKRKRSIKKFAETAGFKLTGSDPRERENWAR